MELNKTIQHYFHQPALESVSLSELEKAVQRYPYSAALQFLLLKKMQQEKDPGFDRQFAVASLYYSNPWLLRDLLQASPHPSQQSVHTGFEQVVTQKSTASSGTIEIVEETVPEAIEEQPLAPETGLTKPEINEEAAFPEVLPTWPPVEEAETVVAETKAETLAEIDQVSAEKPEETAEITATPASVKEMEPKPEPRPETPEESELRTELLMKESPIRIPSLRDLSPQTDELPIFEPYHTIDYFASQGIKLSHEMPVNDKLGRQMKSFTEWIRTMKKLPQSQIERQLLIAATGENIVAMAAGSVKMKDVVTETMAEVLVKQGNIAKAIDLYNKLSLAHPDKSAYFATRIEQLKHS
ncbi:hypothetical protein ACFSQD_06195 [Flavihumibacter stibioxidans]|uniref:Tetratricopeptide repeat protein n=1 Tax=Flavihumibacter stibioxidans TaxID=1834163 RepID=A0ABR7M4F8_9BACT|nr:hypothetical protein [Flavihumibacter stibioxidans]MBC6489897.1 hypothetical protein [Flavihumibacter stibioxidans]